METFYSKIKFSQIESSVGIAEDDNLKLVTEQKQIYNFGYKRKSNAPKNSRKTFCIFDIYLMQKVTDFNFTDIKQS